MAAAASFVFFAFLFLSPFGSTVLAGDDLIKELTTQAKRDGSRFYMHVTNWDHIKSELNAVGDYVFGMPTNDVPERIRGYPLSITDGMPDNSSTAVSSFSHMAVSPARSNSRRSISSTLAAPCWTSFFAL